MLVAAEAVVEATREEEEETTQAPLKQRQLPQLLLRLLLRSS